ncbi:MAG TPA: GNAT family N-acetyltransferase [Candidatus Baltobacteraceae bacterium]|jgi:RimJ/RimL family protein N-acetyltransferase
MWAVALKSTGALVGQCGLNPVEGKGPEVEVAYHFGSAAWNNGYATEAVAAVLDYVFRSEMLDSVIAIVMPENIGSRRVAEKSGMRPAGTGTYYGISDFKT